MMDPEKLKEFFKNDPVGCHRDDGAKDPLTPEKIKELLERIYKEGASPDAY